MYLTPREAAAILLIRIILGTIFVGQPSVLLYSLSGGILCLIGEIILIRLIGKKFICEISIFGAMLHNTAQIICAALITDTPSVFWYLPPLLIAAALTGAFCGLCILGFDKAYGARIQKMLKK